MRNYRRLNYGKELFDKVIHMTNTKPVLIAFEFPNKSLMKFLEKNYGIVNQIFFLYCLIIIKAEIYIIKMNLIIDMIISKIII